jgi:hypothetical protein
MLLEAGQALVIHNDRGDIDKITAPLRGHFHWTITLFKIFYVLLRNMIELQLLKNGKNRECQYRDRH